MNRIPERFFPKVDSEWYRRRLTKAMLCILPVFILLGLRLFYLQILNGEHFHDISKNNCLRQLRIDPLRGQIFDRNGYLLVDNRPAFDLQVIPKDAEPIRETAEKLAELLPMTAQEIQDAIGSGRGPFGYRAVLLQKDIGRDLMGQLLSRRYDLPGIVIQTSPRRNYIDDRVASHMIGYLGEISPLELKSKQYPKKRGGDMVGRYGVEKTFESELTGNPGKQIVQVSATGQVMKVLGTEPAEPGHQVYLTIDRDLQREAERLLENQTGAVAAVDPANGDVLVLASSPTFDQNTFVNGITSELWNELIHDPERPMHNKAVQGEYPPASKYKIITAMAALEEGIITEHTTVFCPGHYQFGNRSYRCWKLVGHGHMNVYDAMAESCDVFFYHVGKQIGVDRLAWYAMACGLGSETGIDLNHEGKGLVPTAAWKKRRFGVPWQPGETLNISIGQGYNLTTPLQMAVVMAGVANGGAIYRPQLLKSIRTVEGVVSVEPTPEVVARMPASEKTLAVIREGLRRVVNHRKGTAYNYVRSPDVVMLGKTGTAQVVSRKSDEEQPEKLNRKHLSHAWFIGSAPYDAPKIAVSVIIEHGEHGSSGAGPVAKAIMIAYLEKLGHINGRDRLAVKTE